MCFYSFFCPVGNYRRLRWSIVLTLSVGFAAWGPAQRDSLRIVRAPDNPRLELGVQMGQSWNEVDFRPGRAQDLLIGNSLELSLRYFERGIAGFQATLGYDQGGWREPTDTEGNAYVRRQDFISLHLLTQVLPLRGAVSPLILGGPYLSVPIAERETIPAGVTPAPNSYVGQALPFRINYGVSFGLGASVKLTRWSIQLDGRYLIGMSDLIASGEFNTSTSRRLVLLARAGVYYAFTK